MQEEKEGNDQQLTDAVTAAQASWLGLRFAVSAPAVKSKAREEGERVAGWGWELDSYDLHVDSQSFSQAQERELERVINDDGHE